MMNKRQKSMISIAIAVFILILAIIFAIPYVSQLQKDKSIQEEILCYDIEVLDPIDLGVSSLDTFEYLNSRDYTKAYTLEEVEYVLDLIDHDIDLVRIKTAEAHEQIEETIRQREILKIEKDLMAKMNKVPEEIIDKIESDEAVIDFNYMTADDTHQLGIETELALLEFQESLEILLDVLN